MENIPIIFLHFGNSDFLKVALAQASYSNPENNIFLIGDSSNSDFLGSLDNHVMLNNFPNCDTEFVNIYKHLSTNLFDYEYFCFKRWFVLYEFMKKYQFEWIFTLDSDIMLYQPIQPYFDEHIANTDFIAAYCIPQQEYNELRWIASGHSAFVSKKFLKEFCNFLVNTYSNNIKMFEEKTNFHITQNRPGGICDMTLLYIFSLENEDKILNLLLPTRSNKVFDLNFNQSSNFYNNEFPKKGMFKQISFEEKIPYSMADSTYKCNG